MKISVITCTYNSSKYIKENMDSVWNQKVKPYEQIVVDAGSTDNTLKIIKKYKGNIKIIHRDPAGISDAMNFGIKNASGDIIQILHSDDYNIDMNLYSKVNNIFKKNVKWVYGYTNSVDENGDHITVQPHPFFRKYSYLKLLAISFIPHPSVFLHKSVFERFGYFREDLKITMDYEYWVRIGKKLKPTVIPSFWTAFRVHSEGMSTKNNTNSKMKNELKKFLGVWYYPHWFVSFVVRGLYGKLR